MSTDVATRTIDQFNALRDALHDNGSQRAQIVRFKKGKWLSGLGDNQTRIPDGSNFVVNPMSMHWTWTLWQNTKPVQTITATVMNGEKLQDRNDLGLLDQDKWEFNTDGKPQDPWMKGAAITMYDPQDGEEFLLQVGSYSARGVLEDLLYRCLKERKELEAGKLPVVRVDSKTKTSKQAKNVTYEVPVMEIIGWVKNERGGALEAEPALADAMNDDLPF